MRGVTGVEEEIQCDFGQKGTQQHPFGCFSDQTMSLEVVEEELIEAVAGMSKLDDEEGGPIKTGLPVMLTA